VRPDAIPLSSLRADLDRGWPPGARWVSAAGPRGARLEQPVGTELAFEIGPEPEPVTLEGEVAIAPGGPRRAKIGVAVLAVDPQGRREALWTATLWRVGSVRLPASRRLRARFDAREGARLVLATAGPPADRVLWRQAGMSFGPASEPKKGTPALAAATGPREPVAGDGPRFSVLTPVHDPPPAVLAETIDSVREQSFGDWELCLFDDGSTDTEVIDLLRRAAEDPRIRLDRAERGGGISAATNGALAMARGEYVALLDHDDLLVPDALERVDAVLRERPDTDMVYSDEEVFEEGEATHVFAKPHWSPDLLRSQMYTCHLGVYRRSLAEQVGGFDSDFDGSQDFDFVLRVSERTDRIRHIPRVLYRWRAHAGSTAADSGAKPEAYPAARRAIARHLERTGVEGDVHFGPWDGIYRVVHEPPSGLQVAVGVVGPREEGIALVEAVEEEADRDGNSVRIERGESVAEAAIACQAGADAVAIVAAAVEPLTRFWLRRLLGFALQPGVAAVGATTLAPDGRVEQAGLAIDGGLPVPLMFAAPTGDPGPLGVGLLPANAAAVSGVVAFAGDALRELGGLDPGLGGLAVPDLCLRGLGAGMRVVTAPDVLLRRTAPPAFVNELGALYEFRRRWAGAFPRDPYFDLEAGWPGVAS
jgi:hypothetical protein